MRTDSRLALLERTNLRLLQLQDLPEARPCQLATLDLSFIALTTVLPAVVGLLAPGARVVALVKPQFEAPRDQVCVPCTMGVSCSSAFSSVALVETRCAETRCVSFAPWDSHVPALSAVLHRSGPSTRPLA